MTQSVHLHLSHYLNPASSPVSYLPALVQKVQAPLFFPFRLLAGGTEPELGEGGKDKGRCFRSLGLRIRLPASPFLIAQPKHLPGRGPFLHLSNWSMGPRCPKSLRVAALRDKSWANKEEGEAKEVGANKSVGWGP